MQIKSAKFIKGIVGTDDLLEKNTPQVALIGRSNVGKSSVINSLTNKKDLARTSDFPGRTRELNLFLINDSVYLVDLPGYGYIKGSGEIRERLYKLINWYLFLSPYKQKRVFLIIDANVGPTDDDLDMLEALEKYEKNIVVVANKIDKIKKSKYDEKFQEIREIIGDHKIIPYSAKEKIGIKELAAEMFA